MVLSDIVGSNLMFFFMLISLQDDKKLEEANDSLKEPGCGFKDPDLSSSMHHQMSSENERYLACSSVETSQNTDTFLSFLHT